MAFVSHSLGPYVLIRNDLDVQYTNFADNPEVSTPRTVRTRIPETRIVASAFRPVERFISRYMPDLVGKYRVWGTRLCWYTDSPSNDWLFDHVPGKEGLLVASGGSGHLFKFLPTVGQHVVAALERRRTPYSHMLSVPLDRRIKLLNRC